MISDSDLIVIGGGAAGMFAAVTAASLHKRVLLLEKNEKTGKKLAITGKGRCNVTNHCGADEVLKNVPRNSRFLFSCLNQFGPEDTMQYFQSIGVPLKTERGSRVFPVSDHAADVVRALQTQLRQKKVQVVTAEALKILTENGHVTGVKTAGRIWRTDNVLLATGGLSYPVTGSTGDGYRFAAALGHTVTPCSGSLVPLAFDGDECRGMAGLSLKNIGMKLILNNGKKEKTIYSDFGEALFMPYGMSGPVILSASAHIEEKNLPYILELDLKPALSPEQLDARMLRDLAARANETIYSCLRGLLPAQLIPVILNRTGVPAKTPAHALTRESRRALLDQIKHFRFTVTEKRPVDEAIVTRGGIKIAEVNPKTMESRLVSGLYFAGEILDCDAYTGGFNLQIAWSTAYAAATAIGNAEKM